MVIFIILFKINYAHLTCIVVAPVYAYFNFERVAEIRLPEYFARAWRGVLHSYTNTVPKRITTV